MEQASSIQSAAQKADSKFQIAGRHGGRISGENRKAKREQQWIDLGIDPVKAEAIRRAGYQAGYAQGRKERLGAHPRHGGR